MYIFLYLFYNIIFLSTRHTNTQTQHMRSVDKCVVIIIQLLRFR